MDKDKAGIENTQQILNKHSNFYNMRIQFPKNGKDFNDTLRHLYEEPEPLKSKIAKVLHQQKSQSIPQQKTPIKHREI